MSFPCGPDGCDGYPNCGCKKLIDEGWQQHPRAPHVARPPPTEGEPENLVDVETVNAVEALVKNNG